MEGPAGLGRDLVPLQRPLPGRDQDLTEGYFRGCNSIAGKQLCSTATLAIQNSTHYNGTYHMGGSTS